MFLWNSTVTFSRLKLLECGEPNLPSRSKHIPVETQCFQFLPALIRHTVFLLAQIANPLAEFISSFDMLCRNLTVAFSLMKFLKQAKPFVPSCTKHIHTRCGNSN